jgi:hypothetical protein
VTPLLRFSPIGASGPVIELTKPILTFFGACAGAPSAKDDAKRKIAVRTTMSRFIEVFPLLSSDGEDYHHPEQRGTYLNDTC